LRTVQGLIPEEPILPVSLLLNYMALVFKKYIILI